MITCNTIDQAITLPNYHSSQEMLYLYRTFEHMRQDIIKLIEHKKKAERAEYELALAGKIQHAFLSNIQACTIPYGQYTFSASAKSIAAKTLNGDIYDIIQQKDCLYLFLGDTTGKDIAASIFSLFVLNRFRMLIHNQLQPNDILNHLNQYLVSFNAENMFMTCICIQITIPQKKIIIANAGHDLPLLVDLENKLISNNPKHHNIALGIIEDYDYQQTTYHLDNIQTLLLFSDGITEAKSKQGQYFGKDALITLLLNAEKNAEKDENLINIIFDNIKCFEDSQQIHDDKTVILFTQKTAMR